MFNLASLKVWGVVGLVFVAMAGFGVYQYQQIALLKSQAETHAQVLETKAQEMKNVQDQLRGAQEAYRTAIAEKHALVSDLYDNRLRLEQRTKELQTLQTQHKTKVDVVRRSTDAKGNLDACLPADVLSLYPNATPCH
jgi:septal ring factor EnvC (AmiA/AmiB activator)